MKDNGACSIRRVLVVESHAETATAIRRLLEHRGFAVRTAGTYLDALAVASSWLPDVLISDLDPPGKDGADLLWTMREAHPSLQAIAISGHMHIDSIQRSREAGFSELLAKPVNIDRLVSAIHRLFAPLDN
jgi:DNA-binding NtrC family response regulator